MMKNSHGFITILVSILIVLAIGATGYAVIKLQPTRQITTDQQTLPPRTPQEESEKQNKNTSQKTITLRTTTAESACRLPIKDFPEHAFRIGVPNGWLYLEDNGTVSIMEDDTNTTTVFLYTAKLERNLTSSQFLKEFGAIFKTIIEGAGGTLTVDEPKETHQEAVANANAVVKEGPLKGVFRVKQDGMFVTLSIYWAPKGQFSAKETLLKDIVSCFSRKIVLTDNDLATAKKEQIASTRRMGGLISHQGNFFRYSTPQGWIKNGENKQSIELFGPDNEAAVSFAHLEGYFGASLDIVEMVKQGLALMGVRMGALEKGIGTNNQSFVEEVFTYRGTLQGHDVQGRIRVINAGLGNFMTYSQLIRTNLLGDYASIVAQIEDSIQITDITSHNVLRAKNNPLDSSSIISSGEYRNQVTSRAADRWSDTMRGYEPVTSPSTGTNYEAPLNAWNPGGPEGSGYYHNLPGGGVEKLIQINP